MVAELPGPDGELDAARPRRSRPRPTTPAWSPRCWPHHPDTSLEQRALEVLPQLRGAFCFVFMDEDTLYAARDPQGIRPLVLGRLERGWVVASETPPSTSSAPACVREIEPGELIVIDEDGLRSHRFAEPDRKGCVFEYVYLARPDTTIAAAASTSRASRWAAGWPASSRSRPTWSSRCPSPAPRPRSGYAEESGIPFGQGFVKNAYVGRTFIQPSQTLRQLGIRLKLNPLRDMIRGKRLVVVDDSIVRGNTQRALVRMLREAGAAEVHVRISSPPVKWPCFYGIDFATRAELIANGLTPRRSPPASAPTRLGYISLDGMIEATEQPRDTLCTACFAGEYPIELPDESLLGKHLLEATLPVADGRQGAARPQRPLIAADRRDQEPPVSDPSDAYAEAGVDIEAGDRPSS